MTFSSSVKNWKPRNLPFGRKTCTCPELFSTKFTRLENLSDPDADPPGAEPSLLNQCDEIRTIVMQEASIIGDVFPHPSTVVQVFLQRIFQQSVCSQDSLHKLIGLLDPKSSRNSHESGRTKF